MAHTRAIEELGWSIAINSLWVRWLLSSPASRLFTQPFIQVQIKKIPKLRVTGLCVGNSSVTDELPAQRISNAENVSNWWRHHGRLSQCSISEVRDACSDTYMQHRSMLILYVRLSRWPKSRTLCVFVIEIPVEIPFIITFDNPSRWNLCIKYLR